MWYTCRTNTMEQTHVVLPQPYVILPQPHVILPQPHVILPQPKISCYITLVARSYYFVYSSTAFHFHLLQTIFASIDVLSNPWLHACTTNPGARKKGRKEWLIRVAYLNQLATLLVEHLTTNAKLRTFIFASSSCSSFFSCLCSASDWLSRIFKSSTRICSSLISVCISSRCFCKLKTSSCSLLFSITTSLLSRAKFLFSLSRFLYHVCEYFLCDTSQLLL